MRLLLLLFLLPLTSFSQNHAYDIWRYEEKDSLKAQVLATYDIHDRYRDDYHFDLYAWTLYKWQCYNDSIMTSYNYYRYRDGSLYFVDIGINDPAFRLGYQGDTTVVERRTPTALGFLQEKLKLAIRK